MSNQDVLECYLWTGIECLENIAKEGDANEFGIDDFGVARIALEMRRRSDAVLNTIKEKQYSERIRYPGNFEETRSGVKIRVVAPTEARRVNHDLVKEIDGRSDFSDWLYERGYPTTLYRIGSVRGYCSISEVAYRTSK